MKSGFRQSMVSPSGRDSRSAHWTRYATDISGALTIGLKMVMNERMIQESRKPENIDDKISQFRR